MSIEALILGKLHEPAKARTSGNTGRQFVTAKVRAATSEAEGVFVNVLAFSESAGAALLALEAGDAVALAGTLKPTAWTDRDGNARPSADLVAAQVMTVYGLTKRRAAVRAAAGGPEPAAAPTAAPARQHAAPPPTEPEDFGQAGDDGWLNGGEA
ncbi:MAG: hypothetical protein RLZZ182_679 [Pseudomonadota bacterium]|jgi:single-stranded DNA-binding protein